MFLDDTACNLASINLLTFRDPKTKTSTLRVTSTPSASGRGARDLGADGAVSEQADRQLSYEYRTLGLGYANIGGC